MIEPVIKRHPGDADAAIAQVGKIGQPKSTRWVLLPEDDILLGAMQSPPGTDAPLQRAADAGADLGVAPPDLVENGDRPQTGDALQQRHHLAVPYLAQRIGPPPAARGFLLRGHSKVVLEAIAAGGREPGLGGGNGRRLGLTETHIQPHLAIGDVAAGQVRFLIGMKNRSISSRLRSPDARPSPGSRRRWIRDFGRATPSLRHKPSGAFSS